MDQKVDVTETRSPLRVVYRLRGAAVLRATNELALQTAYFTTPVARVQLLPSGSDVELVIELREDAAPTYSVVETPRGMVLWVDWPRSAQFLRDEPVPARRDATPAGESHSLGFDRPNDQHP